MAVFATSTGILLSWPLPLRLRCGCSLSLPGFTLSIMLPQGTEHTGVYLCLVVPQFVCTLGGHRGSLDTDQRLSPIPRNLTSLGAQLQERLPDASNKRSFGKRCPRWVSALFWNSWVHPASPPLQPPGADCPPASEPPPRTFCSLGLSNPDPSLPYSRTSLFLLWLLYKAW